MIFKSLTINNFRVFNGEHKIELSPFKSGVKSKPIILFGGLNGAGKTSILNSIRLLLMGKKSISTVSSNDEYEQYLISQINNIAKSEHDSPKASLSLEFTCTHNGKISSFLIERSWDANGQENLSLVLNQENLDILSTEQIQAIISEMIPPGISDLFFFDGEKIAELAEDDTGSYLKEAVQKLLGIDVVNRLSDDLDIYLKQITKDTIDKKTLEQITELEQEKSKTYNLAMESQSFAEELRPRIAELQREAQKIEIKIQERGGAWAKTKKEEKARADELIKKEQQLHGALLQELDGEFPLSLAANSIKKLFVKLESEQKYKTENAFTQQFGAISPKLAESLATSLNSDVSDVSDLLSVFLSSLKKSEEMEEPFLDISDSDFYGVKKSLEGSTDTKSNIKLLLEKLEKCQSELSSLSINIQRAPDDDELGTMYEKLRKIDNKMFMFKESYKKHLIDAKDHLKMTLDIAKRLEKLYTKQKNESSVNKAVTRVTGAQATLEDFRTQLTELRVVQLEKLFTKSYRRLARKDDLNLSALINPKSFDVTLTDEHGTEINRKSLSAGEKQIFAFAILEALGKLSGKSLPVIIDTPLGRLDSKHRDKLITHYFPEASEQVILLSTDTEIDSKFYDLLSERVSHTYEIEFEQESRCSSVNKGYFWTAQNKESA